MSPIAINSNVLVYAELSKDSGKGRRAIELLKRSIGGVIPAQALGELLRVTQRKAPALLPSVAGAVGRYRAAFRTPSTSDSAAAAAAELALERKLQFRDCVICVAAAQAGATVLFSQDMQDGADVRGLKILNPFDARNDARIEALVAS